MCFKSHFFQLSMISTLLVTSLSIGMANNNPNLNKTKSSATQAQEIKQDVPAAIKGSDTPTLIPDSAAYDLFLRSLADGVAAPDVEERRKLIQASKTGVKGNNSGRLISIAQEFGNRAAALDRRAAVIKDKALPTPSIQDVAQLEKLQKEREELIIEFATAIETRLGADDADKLKQYILNEVKKNITAIQIPQRADNHTNHKKIGKLIPTSRDSLFGGQAHSLFPTATSLMPVIQYGMGGYAYVYTESWVDTWSYTLYGRGTVSESYNSYGHTFLHTVNIRSSNNSISTSNTIGYARATLSSTAGLYFGGLIVNGDLTDGDFFLDFSTQERCPASYGALFIFPALTIQQKLAVVDLKNLTASKTTLAAGTDSLTLTADIKVSGALFAPVSVNVIPYAQYTSAGNDIWNPTLQTLSFSSAGTTQQATFTYDFSPITGTSYPLSADLKINLSATSSVTILPPDKKVTINIIP